MSGEGQRRLTAKSTADVVELTAPPPMPDEDEIRRTAYFLWEQDGRPLGQDDHYWWAALEKIARTRSSDCLLRNSEPREA
jgi:hypothetical protein